MLRNRFHHFYKRLSIWTALLTALCLLSACAQAPEPPIPEASAQTAPTSDLSVRMLAVNVGKADAIIIQAGDLNFLIDAGTSKMYKQLEKALAYLEIDRLDAVFLTHTDKDHGGGLKKLADSEIEILAWYASAYYVDKTDETHQAVTAAGKRGQRVTFLKSGDEVVLSDDVRFEVLGPVTLSADSENNNSLVMALHTPQGNLFLAGDMQVEEELSVLKTGNVTQSQVLKVGHHGDDTASSYNLIATVKPQIAVISTSTQEESDTPAPSVLATLKAVGAQTYVTQNATGGVMVTLQNHTASASMISFE